MSECVRCGTGRGLESEHTMGKWLARRTDNPFMAMSFGKRYFGALRIPACRRCNNGDMRELESRVAAAFDAQDVDAVLAVEPVDWAAWASKVMHGLVVQELEGRGARLGSPLTYSRPIETGRALALRRRDFFRAFVDGTCESESISVRAFRTQHDASAGDLLSFLTDEHAGTLLVQVRGIAVFVCTDDGGYLGGLNNSYLDAAQVLDLNPIQTVEIYCRLVDAFNAMHERRSPHIDTTPFGSTVRYVGRSIPGPPVEGFLAGILRWRLGPLGFADVDVLDPPQTWVLNTDGSARFLPLERTRGRQSPNLR